MSYARWSDESDVYVFAAGSGEVVSHWVCYGCCFLPNNKPKTPNHGDEGSDFVAFTPQDMVVHLEAHRKAGHLVPVNAFGRLFQEIDTNLS